MAIVSVAGCTTTSRPTPTPEGATPPPTAPPATISASGLRYLGDFPSHGASSMTSVIAMGTGFLAAGNVFDPEAPCLDDEYKGRLWSSSDGASWTALAADPFAKSRLTQLLTFGDAAYAVGVTGSAEGSSGCPAGAAQPGVNLWRSSDGGATWELLPQSPAFAGAAVADVIVAGEQLVAVGGVLGADSDTAGSWTSPDALTWTSAEQSPAAPSVSIAAWRNGVLVAFGDDEEFPLAWVSRDVGTNWYEETIDVDGAEPSEISTAVEGVVATDTGFVAVGEVCCLGTGGLTPTVFTSVDGTQWIGKPQVSDGAQAMRRVVIIPEGVLAVGVETYITELPDLSGLGGRTWLSSDGSRWQPGPDLAELGDGNISAVAAGPSGVVIAGQRAIEQVSGADSGLRVWFAPYGALSVGGAN